MSRFPDYQTNIVVTALVLFLAHHASNTAMPSSFLYRPLALGLCCLHLQCVVFSPEEQARPRESMVCGPVSWTNEKGSSDALPSCRPSRRRSFENTATSSTTSRIGEFFSPVRFLQVKPLASYFCKQCPCASLDWNLDDRQAISR
ncbi:hypothetical protein LX32DRAFT_693438 [Colletotrichum zoysiae]|uniref:Secreted protein n=1 Tax=Colletotrichum zoysiae TaxID=1216348 RepID=A0AAD9HHV9_9PEZI|nr:hypothetical protein LX32DRAFT_693438 [Colletotrichum zoysiae]